MRAAELFGPPSESVPKDPPTEPTPDPPPDPLPPAEAERPTPAAPIASAPGERAPEEGTLDDPSDSGEPGDPAIEIEDARELSKAPLRGLLEALVFASDKPMKSNELARLASPPVQQVKEAPGE